MITLYPHLSVNQDDFVDSGGGSDDDDTVPHLSVNHCLE